MVLSMTDTAEGVRREHSLGAPMRSRLIAELAYEHQPIAPGGLPPDASLNAAIDIEIEPRCPVDEEQGFSAHGRGFHGLASPTEPFRCAIDSKNAGLRWRLRGLRGGARSAAVWRA